MRRSGIAATLLRGLASAWLLGASVAASACPLCLGAFTLSVTAQDLVSAERAVLAVRDADHTSFRVVAVIKGDGPPAGMIDARSLLKYDPGAIGPDTPLLLLRDRRWTSWANFGAIDASYAPWLRTLAASTRATDMTDAQWQAHVALLLPSLESPEPLVATIAYGELASAPYAALRTLKPRLDAGAIRRWVNDPQRVARLPLYTLLLGIAGDAQDIAGIERQLDIAWKTKDATNVGPLLAADLEIRGPQRMPWIDARYIHDRGRTTPELEAVLLALSVQGSADAAIPRERVIASYLAFIKAHKTLAGFVAQDLAAWNCWDAVPDYLALMRSNLEQHPASRYAMLSYLKQSPRAEAQAAAHAATFAP